MDTYPVIEGNTVESNAVLEVNGKVIELNTKLIRNVDNGYVLGTMPLAYRKIILFMNRHRGQLFSVRQLKNIGWESEKVTNSSVIVAISEIRSILGDGLILTITGEGYVFQP
ncbi:helix-turn-helix domain-containing protein [Vibrio lentus]|uniref:OmpR/PhoB-type domain-containing protein n=1 Tax=Vibrio lentus TaxID=136468 RepID=A0AA45AA24_9VIBR|nr:helix-turn-helix domain-containing protein [Vibrio lentus]MCB5360008.1 helix-turn-helix domain-containing protein [Vibrio lentus]MCB5451165.1 helix-turn-helix domain-containing protein [Vibrio lentus]MCB5463326.1 helix-turn-helix domain-containing protein [Vibrio lentus]MCC4795823.1 helix-turn-helix domain-containing protein [Vibrio lentus]MCC4852008.1 helix-turn-helix domain-containing protein [Vibrio lentus]